jgi:hypothetical protein
MCAVAWLGPKQLRIAYDQSARVFLSATDVDGVRISYVQEPSKADVILGDGSAPEHAR